MPSCGDPEMDRYTTALRQILDHHVLLLKTSLGFLAGEARCALLGERLDTLDRLGAPAHRLEAIRAQIILRARELRATAVAQPATSERRLKRRSGFAGDPLGARVLARVPERASRGPCRSPAAPSSEVARVASWVPFVPAADFERMVAIRSSAAAAGTRPASAAMTA